MRLSPQLHNWKNLVPHIRIFSIGEHVEFNQDVIINGKVRTLKLTGVVNDYPTQADGISSSESPLYEIMLSQDSMLRKGSEYLWVGEESLTISEAVAGKTIEETILDWLSTSNSYA